MARHTDHMNAVPVEVVPSLATPGAAFAIEKEARDMGSSWSRRDRIIRLAKLRGDRAALAIMEGRSDGGMHSPASSRQAGAQGSPPYITESELRALWGDR